MPRSPVIACEPYNGQWRFFCRHCQTHHYHGADPGHRVAHCSAPSPYRDTGYILRLERMPKWKKRQLLLPYGKWTCEDGSEVLFNRKYEPIFCRRPNGTITEDDRERWVDGWTDEAHFYNDGTPEPVKWRIGCSILQDWGLPVP
jgi:hypothetical protein